MGGYEVRTKELKVSTGPYVSGLASTVDAARLNLEGLGRLPPVEAGKSIATTLTSVERAWDVALPDMAKELGLLGDAVVSSATMMEKVEINIHDRFSQFSR